MRGADREENLGHIDRGAQSELEISADLIRRGFAVFRNQSPQGPVDMVAMSPSNGAILKVQATTASRSRTRQAIGYDHHKKDRHWDVLAVRFPDEIRYYKRSGVQIHPTSRGARSLLNTAQAASTRVRPRDDPNDDPSRRRYLIALAVRELGPGASPYARRRAVRHAIEEYYAERNLDRLKGARPVPELSPPTYPVPVEPGPWKTAVDPALRAEIERRFNQPAVDQASQPTARGLLSLESEGVSAMP